MNLSCTTCNKEIACFCRDPSKKVQDLNDVSQKTKDISGCARAILRLWFCDFPISDIFRCIKGPPGPCQVQQRWLAATTNQTSRAWRPTDSAQMESPAKLIAINIKRIKPKRIEPTLRHTWILKWLLSARYWDTAKKTPSKLRLS